MRELIAPIRKAVAAAVSAAILTWLAKNGVSAEISVGDAVQSVVGGGVAGLLTWALPNRS